MRLAERGATPVILAVVAAVGLWLWLRLALSSALEIDEAQFVGAVDIRLVYDNSHPPLYNWLVRLALEVTGWNWPLAVSAVKAVCLAATSLCVFDAARRLGGVTVGVLALALTAFLPQVSWMSAHTLAHSVLVMAAAAATVAAFVAAVQTRGAAAFLALGLAAGVGVMAKYNMALLLVPLAFAAWREPAVRAALAGWHMLLAAAAFALVAAPALAGIAAAPDVATERMAKLYGDSLFSAVDLPLIGVDGLLSLGLAVLAWGGVVLALTALAGRATAAPLEAAVVRVLWSTMGFALTGFALYVLVADIHTVKERYLTPVLMPLPVVAAMALRTFGWRARLVQAGFLVWALVPVGLLAMTLLTDHRWARPYQAVADDLARRLPDGAVATVTWRQPLGANVALALQRAGRQAYAPDDPAGRGAPILLELTEGTFRDGPPPCGTAHVSRVPLANRSGKTMVVTARWFRRGDCPP